MNKNSISLMLNSYSASFLGFIFWIIVSRLYEPGEIGIFVTFISIASLISTVSLLGFDYSLIRFLKKYDNYNSFINSSFSLVIVSSISLSLLFFAGVSIWAPKIVVLINQPYYILLFLFFSVFYALSIILNNIFIAFLKSHYYLLQNLLTSILKIIILVILFLVLGTSILEPWIIAIFLSFMIGIYYLRSEVNDYKFSFTIDRGLLSKIFRFSSSNYLVSILGNGTALILPLMVLNIIGSENSAYYYISFTLGSLLFVIPNSFSTSLFAESSSKEIEFKSNLKKVLKKSYLMLLPIVIGLILFGKYVLLIFGNQYIAGSILLSYLAISSLFIAINSFYNTYLRINLKMKELISITAYSSITLLFLSNYFMNMGMGISGVGMAYLISSSTISIYVTLRFLTQR